VSLPLAISTRPAETAAPEPALEPLKTRSKFHGLFTGPNMDTSLVGP
jgi:hypothetical protein